MPAPEACAEAQQALSALAADPRVDACATRCVHLNAVEMANVAAFLATLTDGCDPATASADPARSVTPKTH